MTQFIPAQFEPYDALLGPLYLLIRAARISAAENAPSPAAPQVATIHRTNLSNATRERCLNAIITDLAGVASLRETQGFVVAYHAPTWTYMRFGSHRSDGSFERARRATVSDEPSAPLRRFLRQDPGLFGDARARYLCVGWIADAENSDQCQPILAQYENSKLVNAGAIVPVDVMSIDDARGGIEPSRREVQLIPLQEQLYG
jgi:hypothetical protein